MIAYMLSAIWELRWLFATSSGLRPPSRAERHAWSLPDMDCSPLAEQQLAHWVQSQLTSPRGLTDTEPPLILTTVVGSWAGRRFIGTEDASAQPVWSKDAVLSAGSCSGSQWTQPFHQLPGRYRSSARALRIGRPRLLAGGASYSLPRLAAETAVRPSQASQWAAGRSPLGPGIVGKRDRRPKHFLPDPNGSVNCESHPRG